MARSAEAIRRSLAVNLEGVRRTEFLLSHPEDERWDEYSSVSEVEELHRMYANWADEDENDLDELELKLAFAGC